MAAAVERDVDRVSKWSHLVALLMRAPRSPDRTPTTVGAISHRRPDRTPSPTAGLESRRKRCLTERLEGKILIEHTRPEPGVRYVGNGRPRGGRGQNHDR
jgi:hypothetical protein